jgi:RNA polymerase sigma-70 factor (ECF subfamily)
MSGISRAESPKFVRDSAGNRLWRETSGNETRYYVTCVDGRGIERTEEVKAALYLEMLEMAKKEQADSRKRKRHPEESLMEEEQYEHILNKLPNVEETVIANIRDEHLRQAVLSLPEIQRRRFRLHYEAGLTYEQIAKLEGRKKQTIAESVMASRTKIVEALKNS